MVRVRLTLILLVLALCGCTSMSYSDTNKGVFTGRMFVEWVEGVGFIFRPDEESPLTFTPDDGNGKPIRPGVMYTDGGSIPRFLWGLHGFSPWEYAKAYIIHDWLFEAQHCGYKPDNSYSFSDSHRLMGETLKTLMETVPKLKSELVFDAVTDAVSTPIARYLWVRGGCNSPLQRREGGVAILGFESVPKGRVVLTIE
uniref:DUF1353 domain-containing protein n=1 Tax=Dechloromonas aromatica (strain RCB) TaxID=159087 RepID=Q47D40_DECAR